MPIVMINMVLNETLNYMNVMIVQNVLWNTIYELQFKNKQKIMKNYNWKYFIKTKLIKNFQNQKQKPSTVKEKLMWRLFLDLWRLFWVSLEWSVRGINKAKRELGFALMALNIRKVTAQRDENNQKNYKKTISILFQ